MYKTLKNIALSIVPVSQLKKLEPVIRPILGWHYRGNAVYCPICEKGYKQFIPLRDDENTDRLCPYCSSIQRKRLLWLYLEKVIQIQHKKRRVLDFTPHPGMVRKIRKIASVDYLTTDYESKRWDRQYDITHIPEDDHSFDLIICYHILEHVPDDRQAMAELHRIIKPGGLLLTQVPHREIPTDEDPSITDTAERLKRFGQEDHVRYYNREDFVQRLEKAGFSVNQLKYAQQFSEEEQEKLVLNKEEIIFVCSRN